MYVEKVYHMLRADLGYVEVACHVEQYHNIITESQIMGRKKPPCKNKHGKAQSKEDIGVVPSEIGTGEQETGRGC